MCAPSFGPVQAPAAASSVPAMAAAPAQSAGLQPKKMFNLVNDKLAAGAARLNGGEYQVGNRGGEGAGVDCRPSLARIAGEVLRGLPAGKGGGRGDRRV